MIRFAAPQWLLITLPLALLVVWRLRRLPRTQGRWRRRAIQVLSALSTICVALAIARPEIGHDVDRLATIFVLDVSESARSLKAKDGADPIESIQQALQLLPTEDQAGLVVVGEEARTEALPGNPPALSPSRPEVASDGTDLAAGIVRALADLPDGHVGKIVLISDGLSTRGDALRAARMAAARAVKVDILPLDKAAAAEIAIEKLDLPHVASEAEPVELRVVTKASEAAGVRLRVLRDDIPIAEGRTRLAAGDDARVLRLQATTPGLHRYDVLIEPTEVGVDATLENNEASALLRVVGKRRVLLLSESVEEAAALQGALAETGVEVIVGDRSAVPPSLTELANYDLLVLSDLRARAFTVSQMRDVERYVRDLGGGLLMLGGRRSFGLGGYASTPIEKALPATFDLRTRRGRASLAMVIAIDKSGSMTAEAGAGRTKLDLANEAAARSAELLAPADRVGVMHVGTAVSWTQPMVSVTDPRAIASACRGAQPGGGGIDVDVAIEAAYRALDAEETQLKHFLLFADGDDAQKLEGMRKEVAAALSRQITTSVVSMGHGTYSAELEAISREGEGRFYIVDDLRELPQVFTQETVEASRAALKEERFQPSLGTASATTKGIDWSSAPPLAGHAIVNARPAASVSLGATEGDPLLLEWHHGLGRAAVFASDAGAKLSRPWLVWPGFGVLLNQLGRSLMRPAESAAASIEVEIRDGEGRVVVEAIDGQGRYRNYLELEARITRPGGDDERATEPLRLEQRAPGRYEARFDATSPGAYWVTTAEQGRVIGSRGVLRGRGLEQRGERTDLGYLSQIAAITGGRVLENLSGVFHDRPESGAAYDPIWRPLVMSSLMLLLASVIARRWIVPEPLARWLRRVGRLRRGGEYHDRGSSAASPTALERLQLARRAKQAAEVEHGPAASIAERTGATRPSARAAAQRGQPHRPPDAESKSAAAKSEEVEQKRSLAEQLLAKKRRR